MTKIINFKFREHVIIERIKKRKEEVSTITIVRHDRTKVLPYIEVPLTSEDYMDIVEVLLNELSDKNKHDVIMKVIAAMPDYMKRQYAPADKGKRRW